MERCLKITFYSLHPFERSKLITPLKSNMDTQKWMVGILVSFWDGLFSGTVLVSGRVTDWEINLILGLPNFETHHGEWITIKEDV